MSHRGTRWRQGGRLAIAGLLPVLALFAADRAGTAQPRGAVDAALIQKYCASCHNDDQWSGGLSLDPADWHATFDGRDWRHWTVVTLTLVFLPRFLRKN
jgi:mono/diheme cytochrome c family protein